MPSADDDLSRAIRTLHGPRGASAGAASGLGSVAAIAAAGETAPRVAIAGDRPTSRRRNLSPEARDRSRRRSAERRSHAPRRDRAPNRERSIDPRNDHIFHRERTGLRRPHRDEDRRDLRTPPRRRDRSRSSRRSLSDDARLQPSAGRRRARSPDPSDLLRASPRLPRPRLSDIRLDRGRNRDDIIDYVSSQLTQALPSTQLQDEDSYIVAEVFARLEVERLSHLAHINEEEISAVWKSGDVLRTRLLVRGIISKPRKTLNPNLISPILTTEILFWLSETPSQVWETTLARRKEMASIARTSQTTRPLLSI